MSQIRLYLDEDAMRKSLVFALRARNVDVVTAAEADMISRPDEEHLMAASALRRALLTYNTGDYCALHQRWMSQARPHAGIVGSGAAAPPGWRRTATDHAADQPSHR